MFAGVVLAAVCLIAPVNGPVVSVYSPTGSYSGHWGVDYGAEVGSEVHAPVSGRVTFAGSVAGMKTITIQPVAGLKVSVSYLDRVLVDRGVWISRGAVIGASGSPHGVPGVHLSTRIDGRYVDPAGQMGCRSTDISRALRLVTPPPAYARRRAQRNHGRDIRSDPYRPPARGRSGPSAVGARSCSLHPGR